ncbi:MAG: hydrogenase [Candidatus Thermoplasmatota archaeon]|nr:hydrogenase [Candidatus Thermoplasmatota archaeon]
MDASLTLETGSGFWTPVLLLLGLVVCIVLVLIIRAFGEKSYKRGTEQTKPFLSGNAEGNKDAMHVRAGNIYWGFLEALKGYYTPTVGAHTGDVTDYLIWYIGVMAVVLGILLVGVLL